MSLRAKQARFVRAYSEWLSWVHAQTVIDDMGPAHPLYQLTLGDAYRDPRLFNLSVPHPYSSPSSRHTMRLAIDHNLFIWNGKNWIYATKTTDWEPLGLHWESLGGIWGGRFGDPDGTDGPLPGKDGNHLEWPL